MTLSALCRRYPLTAYFILAYTGSWLMWGLFVLSRDGRGILPFDSPASFMVLMGLGTFSGPAVGALVVTAATEGREGVAELFRRIARWRVSPVWYAFAFLGLPAIQTLGTIAIPNAAAIATPVNVFPELLSAAVFLVFPALFAGPLGEEIGWRGYALPNLQDRYGPVLGSLILGILWAVWHAPIWFSGQWSEPNILNVAAFVFWITAATFIFTWVFNNTRGSVFVAILLHAVMDVFPNVFLLVHFPESGTLTSFGVLSMYLGLSLGFGVFALTLLALTRCRLGRKTSTVLKLAPPFAGRLKRHR